MFNISFSIHSPTDIQGCFHVFATVFCAIINIVVHVSFLMGVVIFTGFKPSSGIAGSYGNCIFNLLGNK